MHHLQVETHPRRYHPKELGRRSGKVVRVTAEIHLHSERSRARHQKRDPGQAPVSVGLQKIPLPRLTDTKTQREQGFYRSAENRKGWSYARTSSKKSMIIVRYRNKKRLGQRRIQTLFPRHRGHKECRVCIAHETPRWAKIRMARCV